MKYIQRPLYIPLSQNKTGGEIDKTEMFQDEKFEYANTGIQSVSHIIILNGSKSWLFKYLISNVHLV